MKVGASKGVIRVDLEEETWPGGFPGNQKTPGYSTECCTASVVQEACDGFNLAPYHW